MNDSKQTLLNELIGSLRNEPEAWSFNDKDQDNVRHRSGIIVWAHMGNAYVWQPNDIRFGFFGYLRLRHAYRAWRRVRGSKIAAMEHDRRIREALALLRSSALRAVA